MSIWQISQAFTFATTSELTVSDAATITVP
jgi:hypothetical protein